MSLLDTLDLKDQQPDAAATRGRDVSVDAGAGSGKTRTLVARYLTLLDERHPPRSVVAVTFTKKAAREMRNRIRQEIHDWVGGECPPADRERWRQIEADVDTARIGTIHSLCEAVLRAHPAEAGIDPGFEVLDEGLAAALSAQTVDDALDWASQQPELLPLFDAYDTRTLKQVVARLLAARLDASSAFGETDLQVKWQAALRSELNAFVIRVEDTTTQLGKLSGRELLADAGDKLAEQVNGFLEEWAAARSEMAQGHLVESAHHLFSIRRGYCNSAIGKRTSRAKALVRQFRDAYDASVDSWLGGKKSDDAPPDPALEMRTAATIPLLQSLYAHALGDYESAKGLRHALDFDDLEARSMFVLQDSAIRARWQGQIDAVLVDEFQDTNERQRKIVEALAGTNDGAVGRLFVVGDAKQSIYRFRGADVGVFRDLDRTIRARGGLPITLNRTFRAHAGMVNALNDLLQTAMESDSVYAVPFSPLTADRVKPEGGVAGPYVEFLYGLGESADEGRAAAAHLLAARLGEMHRAKEITWDQVALLFRASTGFPEYEQALESAGIPFVTVAGRGFYDRPEVRDLLNILRALADPWDDLAMAGLLRSPAFGVSDEGLYHLRWTVSRHSEQSEGSRAPDLETIRPDRDNKRVPASYRTAIAGDLSALSETDRRHAERAKEIVEDLHRRVDRVSVAELLKQVLDVTLYPAILSAEGTGARLQRNVDKLLSDTQASGIVRVGEFLEYIESLREAGAREGEAPSDAGGAVRLMTVHKAKGLEFPVVVLADASRGRPSIKDPVLMSSAMGLVPNPGGFDAVPLCFRLAQSIEREQSDAEDLRLLYVAATRVREKLIVCGHRQDRNSGVWLDKMAAAAGLDLGLLVTNPGEWQTAVLPQSHQPVRGMGQAVQHAAAGEELAKERAQAASKEASLYAPLAVRESFQVDQKESSALDSTRRLRRVVGRHRGPEGTILGSLVHAALQRWRFPGDAGLDELLRAEALMEGVVDRQVRDLTIAQAKELLDRFRRDARFAELSASERWHEVPYSRLTEDALPDTGAIDLLYRDHRGAWHIVDFKTDDIQTQEQLNDLEGTYTGQLLRYQAAFRRLMGQSAQLWSCYLNYAGAVRWEQVQ